jgi:uncharacterized membrane protein YkoI
MQHKQGIRTALFAGAAALGMAVSSAGVAWAISPSTAPPAVQTAQVSQMASQGNDGATVETPKTVDPETAVETSDATGAAETPATVGASTSSDAAETPATVEPSTSNDATESDNQTSDVQEPSYESSITAPQDEGLSEADQAAALEALATITPAQARDAALAAVPGTAGSVELDNENGAVVYSVEITDSSGSIIDVKVDAGDGTILNQQASHSDEASDQPDGPDNDNSDNSDEASDQPDGPDNDNSDNSDEASDQSDGPDNDNSDNNETTEGSDVENPLDD